MLSPLANEPLPIYEERRRRKGKLAVDSAGESMESEAIHEELQSLELEIKDVQGYISSF